VKCAIALACLLAGLPAAFAEDVTAIAAKEIRSYTGRCTRIVWVRSSGGIGSPFGPNKGEAWTIMAMDTDDGGKERALIQQRGDFHHTMITPTGTRVIWTDGSSRVWIADWDGKNVKKLMEPFLAVGVAEDPHGTEWVYVDTGKKVHASNTDQIAEIVRFQIDDLSKKELVWNKSGCNDKWEFTRDGKIGASGLPWPNAGVVSLPNGNLLNFGVGCTPGVSGDGTLVEHMNPGGHRGVYIYNADGSNKRYIDFRVSENPANTGEDPQFWWVSFARYDKRFMTMSGPHPSLGYKQSKGNIIFMVLNATFSGMAKYIMVTNYPEVETHAYAWIGDPTMAPAIVT